MQSTFIGIEIGKRSLMAHNKGMATIGHNLSNASTEGYSRQRVEFNATDPIYDPSLNRQETPGQIGQGVDIERIERIRDSILEGRIVSKANGQGYWESMDKYMLMVEQVYNEPTDMSVRNLMDRFWQSWQELSLRPAEMSARNAVLNRGQSLIDGIHSRFASLKQIRDMVDTDIKGTVQEVNNILDEISKLNKQVVKIKAMGDNPNDILDRRDLLVQNLSSIIDISVDNRDPDEFTIHTGGFYLIQGGVVNSIDLKVNPENEGYSDVVWKYNDKNITFRGGKLQALLELRDIDIKEEIQKLDNLTVNFIDLVNENHRKAYGLNGKTNVDFFMEYPFVNNVAGNYDRNGDGAYDSSYIFKITGVNRLGEQEQIGLSGKLLLPGKKGNVEIEYFPTDTVGDLVKRINNSDLEITARLDSNNRLSLRATAASDYKNPDFVIRHLEDSGSFLTGYAGILLQNGTDSAYTWEKADSVLSLRGGDLDFAVAPLSHPAGWISVNPDIVSNPASIASGFGENGRPASPGDGSAANAIASLRNQPVMIGQIKTFDDYFAQVVADAGLKGQEAKLALDTENLIMKELEDLRQGISGVNIDEELAQMIKFQHGYSAAARFISEVNTMLDTIINRMGV